MPDLVAVGNTFIDCILMPGGSAQACACGGNALYTAVGMHFWSDSVGVVSKIGYDYPQNFIKAIADSGIDASGIRVIDVPHALVSGFRYFPDGSRKFFWPDREKIKAAGWESPMDEIPETSTEPARTFGFDPTPSDVPEPFWNARGFGVASMVGASQAAFACLLAAQHTAFSCDSQDPDGNEAAILSWLPYCTAFLPSSDEMSWLIRDLEPLRGLYELAKLGTAVVGFKQGAQGSTVMDVQSGAVWHIPPYPTKVIDPTGAGDAYCGGFLAGYLETGDALLSAMMGTVSASIVIEGFDVRNGLGFPRREAQLRLKHLRPMVTQYA